MSRWTAPIIIAVLAMVSGAAVAAAPVPEPGAIPSTVVAPGGMMPLVVQHAGHDAVDAYRTALASPEVLRSVPCTCGCAESLGHQNNFECYVDGVYADGAVSFSTHGIACYVCQVITRDAVAGSDAGLDAGELHRMILDRYGPKR